MNEILSLDAVTKLDKHAKDALRSRMQVDVFWMANQVLRQPRFKPLVYSFHGRICETFAEPEPNKPVEEWGHDKRTRIVLAGRGSMKSWLGAVWLTCLFLCAPNTRVLILSGEASQAESICRMVQANLLNPVVQYLFPAYKPKSRKKLITPEYWCPARDADDNERDASISCATFHSTKAGKHASVLYLDDCTNEQNTNATTAEKTLDSWEDTRPVGNPNHLTVCLATRWIAEEDLDLPMVILNENPEDCVVTTLPVWTVKTTGTAEELEARAQREKAFKLNMNDVVWAWDKLATRQLFKFYRTHPKSFYCQYLLAPEIVEQRRAFFSEQLIRDATCSSYDIWPPHLTETFLNFDLSSSSRESADDSVGMVFVRNKVDGRMVLCDGFVEKFTDTTAFSIIELIRDYNPKLVRIESSMGSVLLTSQLLAIAQKLSLNVGERIVFEPPNQIKDSKKLRIIGLASAFDNGRFRIYENYKHLDLLSAQLRKVTTTSRFKGRDDLADCAASAYIWMNGIELEENIDPRTLQPSIPDFDPIPVPGLSRDVRPVDRSSQDNERSAAKFQEELLAFPKSKI